ncbi:phospholipase D-like domain-containing protein [uncultured Nevskia sp.]|uniref:phospholipase D-like domain-containing protein n=1 Tax=uncultured Nevskia sp. TaxID=228950 RepID=UPI0025CEE675|nr:phospholipase D-like domain-containing protein [uncultured Nevskia sp.]
MITDIHEIASWLLPITSLLLTTWTAAHALLHKHNAASAWGWIGACLLLPFAGPVLYFVFGINRVLTRAQRQQQPPERRGPSYAETDARYQPDVVPISLSEVARSGDVITGLPLLTGNRLDVLHNGEAAYPRMLAAIDAARYSIALTSYIFDRDEAGEQFIEALDRAQARGVEVRCLLDGVGELAWRRAGSELLARGVPVVRYNPLRLWPPFLHINLRNHRKLLIVDGAVAFTGGMNISATHYVAEPDKPGTAADLQVEIRGPVIAQLQQVFIDDWAYAAEENWTPPTAPSAAEAGGNGALCRVITDGPNEDFGHLSLVLLAAIAAAQERIQIVTPYFVPPDELLSALMSAAVRGVVVDLILSRDRNHRITWYAMHKLMPPLLKRGVRIHLQPPPFCHTKLFVVDRRYAQFGSANLDMRSLRLNFEMVVETYDRAFVEELAQHCDALSERATTLEYDKLRRRPVLLRLRDAACWLLSPYL